MKYLTLLLLLPMYLHPAQSPDKKLVKTVDNTKRKAYYLSCKAQKQKDCHMKSFNASITYQFVGE